MSELFHSYEQEFIVEIKQIRTKLQGVSVLSNRTLFVTHKDKKQLAFTDLKSDLTQCERHIKLMETEISTLGAQTKFEYLRKVRQYKKDYDFTKKALYKQEESYALEKNKQMLIGAELDEFGNGDQGHKEKLISQGEKLSNTNYKLKESVQMMHETEDISNNIGVELQEHTGRLLENKEKLIGMRGQLHKSEKAIKRMMGRIRRNKFVLFSVIALIFLIAIIILGIHFGGGSDSDPAPTPTPTPEPVPEPHSDPSKL